VGARIKISKTTDQRNSKEGFLNKKIKTQFLSENAEIVFPMITS
jgi:hypothetical protein